MVKSLGTHLTEIAAKDILSRRSKNGRKVEGTSFRLLPATNSFDIWLNEINPLLEQVGIRRRMPNKMEFKTHTNEKMNRYARYMISRLNETKDDPEKYWDIALKLIKESETFQVMAFHDTFPRWYKEMPFSFVKNIVRRLKTIMNDETLHVKFKRVNIPKKPEDEQLMMEYIKKGVTNVKEMKGVNLRPLGVPTHAWRVALKLHAWVLALYLKDEISENQHAYVPGRGTTTAWEMILNKVKDYKYIYEIDLKQCFPNIQGDWVTKELLNAAVPERYVSWIEKINQSTIDRPQDEEEQMGKLEEVEKIKKAQIVNLKPLGIMPRSLYSINGIKPLREDLYEKKDINVKKAMRGLPQGANTSPILTELVLDMWMRQMEWRNDGTSVFYADDGLFMSNNKIRLKNDPSRGIEIHKEKSGYVKYDGEWIKELKFLGVVYNGMTETLRSETRKGTKLEIAEETGNVLALLRELRPSYDWNLGSLFKQTSLGGVIMNRLYSGKWELKEYPWETTFSGIKGSYLEKKGLKDNFKTTTSDAVSFLASGWKGEWDHVEPLNLYLKKQLKVMDIKGDKKVKSRKWFIWKNR